MIEFTPVEACHASLQAFERQLVRVVAQEHKETLHAFLKYNEYSLRFEKRSRKSGVVIPMDDQMSRETGCLRAFALTRALRSHQLQMLSYLQNPLSGRFSNVSPNRHSSLARTDLLTFQQLFSV
jgi:hypothetical protein